jgi:hypothetical protein
VQTCQALVGEIKIAIGGKEKIVATFKGREMARVRYGFTLPLTGSISMIPFL